MKLFLQLAVHQLGAAFFAVFVSALRHLLTRLSVYLSFVQYCISMYLPPTLAADLNCICIHIQDENQTVYLARNEPVEKRSDEDPMIHVQALRSHLFNGNVVDDDKDDEIDRNNTGTTSNNNIAVDFQLLERVTLMNMLNDYVHEYRNLLKLASTPIPFPLIQMARTFLFLWTFTIPLVLRGVVSGEALAALVFVFFLTYGFIGLELVAMKLMYPFGDEVNDLNVSGMREVRGAFARQITIAILCGLSADVVECLFLLGALTSLFLKTPGNVDWNCK
jgi:Bestrophin, RFP-TM, chloride channel